MFVVAAVSLATGIVFGASIVFATNGGCERRVRIMEDRSGRYLVVKLNQKEK